MRHPLSYFISIPMAICLILGAYAGGAGFLIIPIVAFLFAPLADLGVGQSRWPSEKALQNISPATELAYDAALLTAGIVTLLVLAWSLWAVTNWDLPTWQFVGLVISVGSITGYTGIVVAHEMMHRESKAYRIFAWILMGAAIYPHYPVEHVLSHHPKFGTPEDAATARRGETVYNFVLRAIFVGLINALKLRPIQICTAYVCVGLALFAIHQMLGVEALMLAIFQGLFAASLLEAIQYQQHYGLVRAKLPNGQYKSPGPGLSWDSSSVLTNINLFNLARHSDHHSFSRRPYYRLRHSDAVPQLPYGYGTMLLISLLPPLWFRIMDRRVDAWQAQRAQPLAKDAEQSSLAPQ